MIKEMLCLLIDNYFEHRVGRKAASLAYYLLFAMFPLLIFISNLLGRLEMDVTAVTKEMQSFLPRDAVDLIGAYLEHVAAASETSLLWFSLVFTIYFPMRATKGVMDDVRTAYHLGKPKWPVSYGIRQLLFTVVWLVVIMLALTSSTLGQKVFVWWGTRIPDAIRFWAYLRFPVLAACMLIALTMLYAMAQDRRQPLRSLLPGAGLAAAGWLAASIGFSFYAENFANYSVIYGTLGAVIVLLLWLYLTAVLLILGAEFNVVWWTVRKARRDFQRRKNRV